MPGRTHIRRVAYQVDFFLTIIGAYLLPVEAGGVAAPYRPGLPQRNQRDARAKLPLELHVHLVLSNPQGEHRNLGREVINLNPVEILNPDPRLQQQLRLVIPAQLLQLLQDSVLQLAQLLIGDHQKIARPAGRIKHLNPRDPIQQLTQPLR